MSDIIIPEDLKLIIANIIAHKAKVKEKEEQGDNLERAYIENIILENDNEEEKISQWKIEIKI